MTAPISPKELAGLLGDAFEDWGNIDPFLFRLVDLSYQSDLTEVEREITDVRTALQIICDRLNTRTP